MTDRIRIAAARTKTYVRGSTGALILGTARVATANVAASFTLAAAALLTARILGPSGRGVLVLVVTAASYTMLLVSLGIPIPARVMLGADKTHSALGYYLGLGSILCLVQVIVTSVVVLVVVRRSGVPLSFGEGLLAGAYGGSLFLAYLLGHALFGVGRSTSAASIQIAGGTVQLLAVASLGLAGVSEVWPYVGAAMVGSLAQIIVSGLFLFRAGYPMRPSYAPSIWRALIIDGLPGIGLSLGQAAVLRIDRIFVGFFISTAAVGIYSVAATPTELVSLAPTALSQILFYRLASKSVSQQAATRARLISLTTGVAVALVLFIAAPALVTGLMGARFSGAIEPMRILLVAAVALSSYQLDAYSLAASGELWFAGSATIVGLVVVVFADFLLIPPHGIVGAAWASVAAYGSMAIVVRLFVIRVQRRGPVDGEARER